MSFDLVRAGKDRAFWKRLVRKYKKKILAAGWQGPLEPEQLEIDENEEVMHNVLLGCLCDDGTQENFTESDGGGIPGSADYVEITELLGKFFVTGSCLIGGPYDDYAEAVHKAGLGD